MREAFKYLTSLLFLAIVVQVGFAGYGVFHAIDKADKDGSVTKKTIENGFDPHGIDRHGDRRGHAAARAHGCWPAGSARRGRSGRPGCSCSGSCRCSSPTSARSRLRSAASCTGSTRSRSMRGRRCWRIARGRSGLPAQSRRSIRADGRHASRSRRIRAGRLLCGRRAARGRRPGRGRHDRAPADAVGARPARRRTRPSQDQVGLARVREDRAAAGLPLSRQRRGRPGCVERGAARALRRGRVRGRRAERPAHGHSGRRPAGLVGCDGVRRLVQRPSRLPGAAVRPVGRARGRDRQRQRRGRRRAHARADARRARRHGHDRRGDRRVRTARAFARS